MAILPFLRFDKMTLLAVTVEIGTSLRDRAAAALGRHHFLEGFSFRRDGSRVSRRHVISPMRYEATAGAISRLRRSRPPEASRQPATLAQLRLSYRFVGIA